jgi:hypothetical protein
MGERLIPSEPAEVHELMPRDALRERCHAYALSIVMRHVLEPRGQVHSDARDGFINAVARSRVAIQPN